MSHNGMASIKFIASQARTVFQYKNTRIEVLKCCANVYFNKECLIKRIVPSFGNIKLPNTLPAARTTQKKKKSQWDPILRARQRYLFYLKLA